MSTTKHTPGPWHAGQLREQGHQPGVDLVAEDGLCVALVRHEPAAYDRAETLANARLIAAAPELLAVVRELYDLCPRISEDDPIAPAIAEALRTARAVLGKVEGRP